MLEIEGRGQSGEVTLCNSATAILSVGNAEVKVMHPENPDTGQFDMTPLHILQNPQQIFHLSPLSQSERQ